MRASDQLRVAQYPIREGARAFHGTESLLGGIWEIDITNDKIIIEFLDFGNNLRELICPYHREEGMFYIPKYWRKCPVCYDIKNAKFLSSISASG
jgi:hypothetical protein